MQYHPPVHKVEDALRDRPLYLQLGEIFISVAQPQVRELTDVPSLREEFSAEIAQGLISTWVSLMLEAHEAGREISAEDIAGAAMLAQIKSNMRHFPQINFASLLGQALDRFAEPPEGLELPHRLHLSQARIIEARKLIP
jgi:hypothetical protein